MAKARLLDLLRQRNARLAQRGEPASPTADQFPWVPFSDQFWRNEIASREALDAVRVRRYWRVDIDDSSLILFGTNAQVIARALILFPNPKQILVRPCGLGLERPDPFVRTKLGDFYESVT